MSDNVKYEYGCVMAIVDPTSSHKIVEISKKIIPEKSLYLEEGQEYGREYEPHITAKFGLTKNYTREDMGRLMIHLKPFKVVLESIDLFSNPKFDVVKFNAKSDVLEKLNRLLSKLPNVDEHPIYHPHLTLAYVKPGEGRKFLKETNPAEIIINKMKYSNPIGKFYYDL